MKVIHITAYTEDASKVEALKAVMKALEIEFELTKEGSPYSPEFVEKIKQGDEDLKNGKGRAVTFEELDGLWK